MEGKVYVGDLKDATEKELDREFGVYGPLKSVWVARNPSGFAFVEFEDPRDAEDAITALDGKRMCGGRVRVEAATGRSRSRPRPFSRPPERDPWSRGPPPAGRRPFHPEDKCYECGRRGHYAYDCPQISGGRRGNRSRNSRSRSPRSRSPVRRSYSRSRSKSRSPKRRRRTKSISRSRSRSPSPKRQTRSRSRSRSRGAADRQSEEK